MKNDFVIPMHFVMMMMMMFQGSGMGQRRMLNKSGENEPLYFDSGGTY